MMKKIVYLTAFLGIIVYPFCMTSCSKSLPETEISSSSEGRIDWKMEVETSRAAMDVDGSGRFEEGDTIMVHTRNLKDGHM